MSEERWAQLASLRATLAAARQRIAYVTTSLGLQPRSGQVCAMVACPVDPEHRIKEENLPRHAAACRWRSRGYHTDEVPLPGERGDLGLVISNKDARCIILEELCKNPMLKTGPAAVGGLVEGCEAETWQRITVDFTPDERRAIYDHVVAVSAPQRVPPPPELAFSGPRPAPHHGPVDDKHRENLMAKMAAERDARRRRISQKKVSTNRKSHLEVLREVIGNQMQLYSEWLGDSNADLAASATRSPQENNSAASSEVQRAWLPSDCTDLRVNEPVQNTDYNRYRDQRRYDRQREFTRGKVEDSRRGVRFNDGAKGQTERNRDWESKEKDRYRERDGRIRDYTRHRERGRDMEENQKQSGSNEYSEDKDARKGGVMTWESKDKYRERSGEEARYRERYGDEEDRQRERDTGCKDSGKEYARRRDESRWNSGRLRDEKNVFSRRDSSKEDERFHEKRNRNRDDNWERLDNTNTEDKEGFGDRYTGPEREERFKTRPGNVALFEVKQERESDEEGPPNASDYEAVVQVKTEKDDNSVDQRRKRKPKKDYDWSEDSEKEAKKHNKKKKKKHKKHKKRKARSSSELESS